MNPYAANFQVPVPSSAATATATGIAAAAQGPTTTEPMDEGGAEGQEASWVDDTDQHGGGAGGYWDEHGQHQHHHPGYAGEYDPTAGVYHPDGYGGARYHQVRLWCVCARAPALVCVFDTRWLCRQVYPPSRARGVHDDVCCAHETFTYTHIHANDAAVHVPHAPWVQRTNMPAVAAVLLLLLCTGYANRSRHCCCIAVL